MSQDAEDLIPGDIQEDHVPAAKVAKRGCVSEFSYMIKMLKI